MLGLLHETGITELIDNRSWSYITFIIQLFNMLWTNWHTIYPSQNLLTTEKYCNTHWVACVLFSINWFRILLFTPCLLFNQQQWVMLSLLRNSKNDDPEACRLEIFGPSLRIVSINMKMVRTQTSRSHFSDQSHVNARKEMYGGQYELTCTGLSSSQW